MPRPRTLAAGFIAPCLPTKTDKLPSGDLWLHEIKHDGFRVIARKDGDRVRITEAGRRALVEAKR
jgi:ATP-dependent DNA ligase